MKKTLPPNAEAPPSLPEESAGELYAEVAPENDAALDEALGLHPISIRLQKSLLDNLKALAQLNGIGYQPLIRQVLTRWVDSELKNMLNQRIADEREKAKAEKAKAEKAKPEKVKESKGDDDMKLAA
jgi:predicted DNA binding CopG/RHH family protein